MNESAAKRVLIVDDEPGIQSFLKALVEDLGYQVEFADDGRQAFRKAVHEEFDLVLMDLAMPDWNGMDAIRSIKMIDPDRRIIVISGFIDDERRQELESEEIVVAMFNKPIEIEPLIQAIQEAIGASEST